MSHEPAAEASHTVRSKPRRIRRDTFSQAEVEELLKGYSEYQNVILKRHCSGDMKEKKAAAYAQVLSRVNKVGGKDRSLNNIKDKWSNIRGVVKKKAASILKKKLARDDAGREDEEPTLEQTLSEWEMMAYQMIPEEDIQEAMYATTSENTNTENETEHANPGHLPQRESAQRKTQATQTDRHLEQAASVSPDDLYHEKNLRLQEAMLKLGEENLQLKKAFLHSTEEERSIRIEYIKVEFNAKVQLHE